MKVLHLLDSVDRGGAETQVLDICRNASRFGLEVTLVAAGGGALEDDFRNSGAEYIRLNRKLPLDVYFSSQLRRIVEERNIQIVHGYQAVDGLHLYIATRRLSHVKRVLSFQGFIPGRKNRITAKLIAPRMHANISVSESLFTYLKDIGIKRRDNFHIVYNGADPRRLEPTGHSIKNEMSLPETAILGGMVANFVPDPTKDQLTICRAVPSVLEKFPDFHFVFAGRVADGAEVNMADCVNFCAASGITSNVHFLGGRSDIADILCALDVFVFSSRQEGFPVAVSEAMLAGVPLIVSDIEPLREVVWDGAMGQLFYTGDADDLSKKIVGVLQDTEQRDSIAEFARSYALDHFSVDAHLRNLKNLYESLLTKKTGD